MLPTPAQDLASNNCLFHTFAYAMDLGAKKPTQTANYVTDGLFREWMYRLINTGKLEEPPPNTLKNPRTKTIVAVELTKIDAEQAPQIRPFLEMNDTRNVNIQSAVFLVCTTSH